VAIGTDNPAPFWPQIATDAHGNALAVWFQSDGTHWNIWSNRYTAVPGCNTAGTGWGSPVLLETDNAGDAFGPRIAMDASGNALAVWFQSDGTRFNIWSSRYTVCHGWDTPVLIETDNAGDAAFPQIAMDSNGNALALWAQSDGTRFNLWSNRYTVGSGWGSPVLVEHDDAGDASFSQLDSNVPQLAFDAGGNALAVWHQSDGTRENLWSNRYTPGRGWATPVLVETDNAGDALAPSLAIDLNGDALAVWIQSDGTRFNVWANRYE
jgi:hypothetical protein